MNQQGISQKQIAETLGRSRCAVQRLLITTEGMEMSATYPDLSAQVYYSYRCNRLSCPLARMSGLQCFNMGHNGHGINLYGVSMTLMGN